jgi:hypothetical protein
LAQVNVAYDDAVAQWRNATTILGTSERDIAIARDEVAITERAKTEAQTRVMNPEAKILNKVKLDIKKMKLLAQSM